MFPVDANSSGMTWYSLIQVKLKNTHLYGDNNNTL